MPGKTFWAALAVFQVLFGLAVFAVTREYYLREPELPASHPPVRGAAPGTPPGSLSAGDIAMSLDASQLVSNDPVMLSRLADEHFSAGRYREAAAAYERLLAFRPRDAVVLNNLGLTLHYLGRSQEALARLTEGAAADPGNQRVWLTTGFVQSQLGNNPEAREALEKAVETGTDDSVRRSAASMLESLPD